MHVAVRLFWKPAIFCRPVVRADHCLRRRRKSGEDRRGAALAEDWANSLTTLQYSRHFNVVVHVDDGIVMKCLLFSAF